VVAAFRGGKSFVYCLTINPRNRTIISGSFDGRIHIYHVSMKDAIIKYMAHADAVVSLDYFSSGCDQILSASLDGYVRIWEGSSCVATITPSEKNTPLLVLAFAAAV
jgi:WD40 repeat protein